MPRWSGTRKHGQQQMTADAESMRTPLLAASAAHMAGPLITSKHLQVLLPPTAGLQNTLLGLGWAMNHVVQSL